MKTPSVSQLDYNDPLVKRIKELKSKSQLSIILGDFKSARVANKELAEIGVDHFELIGKVPNTVTGRIPLFSKYGFRVLLYLLIDKFRSKTPAEKKFHEMAVLYKKKIIKP